MRLFCCFILSCLLVACGKNDTDTLPEQWSVMRTAFDEIKAGHYEKYLTYVDSSQMTPSQKKLTITALRQKYDGLDTASVYISFRKINSISEDTVELFYTTHISPTDSSYCMDRMVRKSDNWKILLY